MTDNNIQRLYELAGVEKLVEQRYHGSIYGTIENCIKMAHKWSKESGIKIKNLTVLNDENICFDKVYYPPFTVEKQLELIKFVGKLKENNEIGIEYQKDNSLWCTCLRDTYDECLNIWAHHKHFDQALASLILQLWNDLTEEQIENIKEILQ